MTIEQAAVTAIERLNALLANDNVRMDSEVGDEIGEVIEMLTVAWRGPSPKACDCGKPVDEDEEQCLACRRAYYLADPVRYLTLGPATRAKLGI